MSSADSSIASTARAVLVLHGGAGTIQRGQMSAAQEAEHLAALEAALRAGYKVLRENGSALDAVEATVRSLEDCPLFNAGRGAVFNHEGINEMDAAIMDGSTRRAGAVTGVRTIRNPVSLARAVMEHSPFVLMAGRGAEEFAATVGIETADPAYFYTDERWQQLQTQRVREAVALSENGKLGTVGAVAVDSQGNVAAATSTGGMTNKRYGRIGDSPVIGAGTWADANCAISATGHGEFFIRYAAAHDVAARLAYAGETLPQAADAVVNGTLKTVGGAGGLIAIDRHGNFALPFNTTGMYRGYITEDGQVTVAIYREDDSPAEDAPSRLVSFPP